jgi:hypothetical protein
MTISRSALDPDEMARARALLQRPVRRESVLPVLGAAAFAAVAALAFATAMILAPPVVSEHVVSEHVAQGVPR